MKKLLTVVLLGALLVTGCGSKVAHVEGNLNEIIASLYEGIDEENLPMLDTMELTKDNIKTFIGTDEIDFKEAVISTPILNAIAHQVVLIRMNDGATAKEINDAKTKIKENVNPRKWVCVWVEEDDVIIESKGDLIILIMVQQEDIRSKILEGFNSL